jgi:hypothetical protein
VLPIVSPHRASLFICVDNLGASILEKPLDHRRVTITACCEQECRIASIISLSDACTAPRRKQTLDHLQTSFLGCEKKSCLAFIIFFRDPRTVFPQEFHRVQMPANACQMECSRIFNVNVCDIRLTLDKVYNNLEKAV